MAQNCLNRRWLKPALVTLALAALAVLGGCGGGSGAPNNPFAPKPVPPGPLLILPAVATVYSNTPTVLTVTGGVPPYFVVSSDSSALPVGSVSNGSIVLLPGTVIAPTNATITVTDSASTQATATITVQPAPIFNALTVIPASSACGANTICTGGTATATVTVTGPGGAPLAGRQVRFDVVSGAFAIESSDPANPLVATRTVVSDQFGVAAVVIQATPGATTQPGLLRATELTTGEQQTAQFTIVQTINGSTVLSVVPATATITGVFVNQCSSGFRTDYYIYGGTPPYRVTSTFPSAVQLLNTPVLVSGGAFSAITNGTCVNPLTFSILDATGLQTTAQLINQPGSTTPPPPTPPPALVILPSSVAATGCGGKSFNFVIVGGTPGYGVSTSTPGVLAVPAVVAKSGGSVLIGPMPAGVSTTSVIVVDSGTPQVSVSATITCS